MTANDIHVECSVFGTAIYAGKLNKKGNMWTQKKDVTKETIEAVRDYFVRLLPDDKNKYLYEWSRKDGKKVRLSVEIY